MKRVNSGPRRIREVAEQAALSLAKGAIAVPMLGGYCVLSLDREWLRERTGAAYWLVDGTGHLEKRLGAFALEYRRRVCGVMQGPVVARPGPERWDGIGLAHEELPKRILERAEAVTGFGIPEEASILDMLELEYGADLVLGVESQDAYLPGPTVVDFQTRPAVVDRRGKLGILELELALGEPVRLGPKVVFAVLIVCTGNSCRSPMAAAMLARMLEGERSFVFSAGTDAPEGAPATRFAQTVALEHGVDISAHRAQQLVPALVRSADLILVMEEYHRKRVRELVPEAAARTRLLGDVGRSGTLPDNAGEIPDPIGRSIEFYGAIADRIEKSLEPVAAHIRSRLGNGPRQTGPFAQGGT